MEWALANLLNHPEVLKKKAKTELDILVGDHLINKSDFAELQYLQCIISEDSRLYPPTAPLEDTILQIAATVLVSLPVIWDKSVFSSFLSSEVEGFWIFAWSSNNMDSLIYKNSTIPSPPCSSQHNSSFCPTWISLMLWRRRQIPIRMPNPNPS